MVCHMHSVQYKRHLLLYHRYDELDALFLHSPSISLSISIGKRMEFAEAMQLILQSMICAVDHVIT